MPLGFNPQDRLSGASAERPGLARALEFIHPGDTLVVWKLDQLGRSLPPLLEIVTNLKTRGVQFRLPHQSNGYKPTP
ncbi:recombinase family protein [Nitrosococcus wardiae]|uniref:recombinase family protein n=1 Tax=Nitrosococcus wardiae TaxID=1814290 RepID=UPI0023EA5F06|nr:recombinase family protein [Nitrosococcus wardiae]